MRLLTVCLFALMLVDGFGCSSAEEPAPAATAGAETTPEPAPTPAPAPPPAPEPATPAAAVEAPPPAPQMPPFAAVVIQEVKDYDAWKTVFDGDVEARKAGGIVGEGLMRGADDDKLVVVYAPATDAEKLKAFLGAKELKAKMKEAGVKGKPTIYMFKSEGGKTAKGAEGAPMFGAVLKYDTKDFAAFKTAMEAGADARMAAGVVGWALGQGVEKDTEAYVYLQSDDVAKLKAYLAAKETKAAMKAAGAKGQPKATLFKEESMTMY